MRKLLPQRARFNGRSALGRSRLARNMTARETRVGYLFMLPSLVVLTVFVFWPIVQSVLFSVQHYQFGSDTSPWVGLSNYNRLLSDPRFANALRNTVTYTLLTVPVGLLLSLALALAVNERLPFRGLLRGAFYLPVITSFAIIAIVWKFLLDPDIGIFAYWGQFLNLPSNGWLRDPDWAMVAVVIVSIWKGLGFNMIVFLAGLQGISETLYEAAKVDGASRWQRFFHVTLPQLRPTIAFVLIVSIIGAFQVFDVVRVMTPKGGPLFTTDVLVTYIYYQGIELLDISYAASIAVMLLVIVLALTLLQLWVLRSREQD